MNYIYDITLNFNEKLYNFYEWNNDDNIEFFLKIPVFRVEKDVIKDFIKTNFIVEKSFLNKINNKSEMYNKKKNKNNNTCLFSDGDIVLGVLFDEHGNSIKKSFLSIDEEEDILEYIKSVKYTLVDYKIKEKITIDFYNTRSELYKKNILKKYIKNLYNKKEFMKLKYIFYEVYNVKNDNENVIYSKLLGLIENNSNNIYKIENVISVLKTETKTV